MNRHSWSSRKHRPTLWPRIFLVMPLFAFILAGPQCPPKKPPKVQGPQFAPFVRGYLAATVGGKTVDVPAGVAVVLPRDVFLPGVGVFLMEATSGVKTTPDITDLSGRFTIYPKPGRYRLCWESKSYGQGCLQTFVSVSNAPVNLSTVRIPLERPQGTTVVFGDVRMADQSLPRLLEPMAGLNVYARVALLDERGQRQDQVFVNNFGEYLLARVPVKKLVTLRTLIESGTTDKLIRPQAELHLASFHSIPLRIANHPPRVEPLVATDASGRRVKVASLGANLKLEAHSRDADGDPLNHLWLVDDGSGSLSSTTGTSVNWTLPNHRGLFTVTVLVSDGKGGYGRSKLSLRADPRGIPFSGQVDATSGGPVAGAQVEINGATATTDAAGFFHMFVPDADRFVFNIRKTGFGLVSKIYDDSVTGGRWTMTRATLMTVDPTQPIDVINSRQPSDCPGPLSERLDWRRYAKLGEPLWQDGKGNVVLPFAKLEVPLPGKRPPEKYKRECGPGIRLQIPANSLVDANGNPPAGNVQVSLSTVDLMSPEQMPGDYTVRLPAGTQVMQSYGAGTIEVAAAGKNYNLKPGAQATVILPVDPSQLAAGGPLPATIPVLFYDEKKGEWIPEGTAKLQGSVYVAKVTHFSAINTDTIKVNQSCVRVNSPTLPATYRLEITIPMGGGAAPKVLAPLINNAPPSQHVVYNLPSNTNIVLVPIRVTDNIPVGTFVVNTGGPQNPTDPNLPAGPPYNACSTQVELHELALPGTPNFGEFLQGFLTFKAANLDELAVSDPTLKAQFEQATANYYAQIDPRGKRLTLAGFKATNGLDGTETRAIYANAGDLGFGRDMHCKQTGQDVACFVTNYGTYSTDDDLDVQDAVDEALNPGTKVPVATVAMEYSRIENPPADPQEFTDPDRVVKFYVYSADGTQLLKSANLDDLGARPIPQLCMVCHGGAFPGGPTLGVPPFNSRNDVKLGSVFIPFDLHFFKFSSTAGFTKADQQDEFKTLNNLVAGTNPTPAIQEVITQMYTANPNQQDENFVVPGWNAQPIDRGMYRDAVGRACRTCHASQPVASLRFNQRTQATDILGAIETRVCTQHVMPHARRTHEIFWLSVGPHMPAQLQVFGDNYNVNGWTGTKCGEFTPGGPTPASIYTSTIQPIWDGIGTGADACTACHTGGGTAGLTLDAGVSYGELVNVNSTQLPSMKRIKPNDVANSYLIHKVEGTQASVGGSGQRMPLTGPPFLSNTDIQKIKDWINQGAPPP